jgi:hypothetical protein
VDKGRCSKKERRLLREAAGKANERELEEHLGRLAEQFESWRRGEVSAWRLWELVHEFDRGPGKQMYMGLAGGDDGVTVARAVKAGRLRIEEVPEEIRDRIRRVVDLLAD